MGVKQVESGFKAVAKGWEGGDKKLESRGVGGEMPLKGDRWGVGTSACGR